MGGFRCNKPQFGGAPDIETLTWTETKTEEHVGDKLLMSGLDAANWTLCVCVCGGGGTIG